MIYGTLATRCIQEKPYKFNLLANHLWQRLVHVTQNIMWLHNSSFKYNILFAIYGMYVGYRNDWS